MRRFMLTSAVLGLLTGAAAPARADISLVFNAAGTFDDGATLSGTLTIDTTIGTVTAVNLAVGVSDTLIFDTVLSQVPNYPIPGNFLVETGTAAADLAPDILNLDLPTTTLAGYSGGVISSLDNYDRGNISILFTQQASDQLITGSLSVAVPEPNTLLVACVGGICAIAYGVANKRRAKRINTNGA